MKNVLLDLEFVGPWQGTARRLMFSTVDRPETPHPLGDSVHLSVPYGTLCKIRVLDLNAEGAILQQFRKVFVACDALPSAEPNERIVVTGSKVE